MSELREKVRKDKLMAFKVTNEVAKQIEELTLQMSLKEGRVLKQADVCRKIMQHGIEEYLDKPEVKKVS